MMNSLTPVGKQRALFKGAGAAARGKLGAAWMLMGCAALLAGCNAISGDNRLVGNRMTRGDQWYGEFGILGHSNDVTIQRGSRITILKIAGDGNGVTVEDGVSCAKIEIWGSQNTVSVPETLVVRDSIFGQKNRIVRRPPPPAPGATPDVGTFETGSPEMINDGSRAPGDG